MLQKVLLACIGLLIMPGSASQMLFAVIVVGLFTSVILKLSPYVYPSDSVLASLCAVALFVATFSGFLLRVGAMDSSSGVFDAIGYVLTTLQLLLPAVCVFMFAYSVYQYSWEVFLRRRAAGVGMSVFHRIPVHHRLSMMMSLKKSQIEAIVKSIHSDSLALNDSGRLPSPMEVAAVTPAPQSDDTHA